MRLKHFLLCLILCLLPSFAFAQGMQPVGGVTVAAVGGGGAYWQSDFETNAACTTSAPGVFSAVYDPVNCQSTENQLGSYGMTVEDYQTGYGVVNLDSSKSEVWVEFYYYLATAADVSLAKGYDTTTALWEFGTSAGDCGSVMHFHINEKVGSSHICGTATPANGANYLRFYMKKATAPDGVFRLWVSTNGTDWTLDINQTGLETTFGNNFANIRFGPILWAVTHLTYDNIKVYHSDPGWTANYLFRENFEGSNNCASGILPGCDTTNWFTGSDQTDKITIHDTTMTGNQGTYNIKLDGSEGTKQPWLAKAFTEIDGVYPFFLYRFEDYPSSGSTVVFVAVTNTDGTAAFNLYVRNDGLPHKLQMISGGGNESSIDDILPDTDYCIWIHYKKSTAAWAEFAPISGGTCTYVGSGNKHITLSSYSTLAAEKLWIWGGNYGSGVYMINYYDSIIINNAAIGTITP